VVVSDEVEVSEPVSALIVVGGGEFVVLVLLVVFVAFEEAVLFGLS